MPNAIARLTVDFGGRETEYVLLVDYEAVTARAEKAEAERNELITSNNYLLVELREAEAEVERLRAALPDADKLDLLADWFDQDDVNKGRGLASEPEVQRDLRTWAKAARAALEGTSDE